jgi:hypothetical protein
MNPQASSKLSEYSSEPEAEGRFNADFGGAASYNAKNEDGRVGNQRGVDDGDPGNRPVCSTGGVALRAPISSFDRRKDAVERLPGKGAVRGKVTAIYRQDFRAKCQVGHRDNAGVREVRSEVVELP